MRAKKYLINVINIIWISLKYLFLISLASLIILLLLLSNTYKNLRLAGSAGLAGKTALTTATKEAKNQNWSKALEEATQAKSNFSSALEYLSKIRSNLVVSKVKLVNSQVNDLGYLLKTGKILSSSLEETIALAQKLTNINSGNNNYNFADLSTTEKSDFLQLIYQSEPKLNNLKTNLDLARANLDKIHKIGILWPIYKKISDIKTELNEAASIMSRISPTIKLLPALAGTPNTSNFLLILQNNDELRPSGGFIGTYGILKIKNGTIISLQTNDSYHLDMPASLSPKWKLNPPSVLKKYLKVKKWYLRDANWSPDWPQSAKKIVEIYNGENIAIGKASTNFTGIIAINPNLVADLIKLIGPINFKGTTYNSKDFQTLLQYNVEVAYKDQNISSWDRKDIINGLMDTLKTRLFKLPSKDWAQFFTILTNNIKQKNIQIYFFNPAWENIIRTLGASGEVINTKHDFLMVVDANLGAFKSDAVVKKYLNYSLSLDNAGVKASLELNYKHTGEFNWRTTRYRSYTRVYVPWGSKLLDIKGLDKSTANISTTNNTELNKTVFGFFFTVEPGHSREITLDYRLPASINKELLNNNYKLLVEKQSGQRISNLMVNLDFGQNKKQNWETELTSDQVFKFSEYKK